MIDRMDVKWGDKSQIELELSMFALASKTYHSYYHLISGVDLPLHSQDYIHHYFMGKQYEYIGVGTMNVDNRILYYNLFTKHFRTNPKWIGALLRKASSLLVVLQKTVGIKRHFAFSEFVAGPNWVSVTHGFVINLLKEKDKILDTYQYSLCADEVYKQTFAYNDANIKKRIFDISNQYHSCLREIDWTRGTPYIWHREDYDELSRSDSLFARKFDEKIDAKIIDLIVNKVINEKM